MYNCVALNIRNLDYFKELNKAKDDFNRLNEDFFEVYHKSNFAQQIFLRRRVRLLKRDSKYIGYIWADMDDKNICSINALNVLRTSNFIPYKALIDTLKKNCTINYLCENNNYNFEILKEIGFTRKDGTLILYLDVTENIPLIIVEDLEFETLKKGIDEQKRCEIQNEIFKNDARLPLTIEDIYFDEVQSYYFDRGSVFLKKNGIYIGYGQIIIENNIPVIVNFGILKEYRGRGYSKSLLTYLIKIIKYSGFDKVKIKVKSTNKIALNLYEQIGFKITNEIYNWQIKT